jgi:hypothetical protein
MSLNLPLRRKSLKPVTSRSTGHFSCEPAISDKPAPARSGARSYWVIMAAPVISNSRDGIEM